MCEIIAEKDIPDDKLYLVAHRMLEIIKLFAVSWKHSGFSEEQEWRVIYLPDRDMEGVLKDSRSYVITSRGVEPKLKLRITPTEGVLSESMSIEKLLDSIILGPSLSSALAKASF